MYMPSEQEREEEKGMPIIVVKDIKTKMIMAKVGGTEQGRQRVRGGGGETVCGAAGLQQGGDEERQ